MITTDLNCARLRDIAPSTEDVGCESGLEVVSCLRDADAIKWTATWKSGADHWLIHEVEPQTEVEGVLVALAALLHDGGHAPFLHSFEQIQEGKESGIEEKLLGGTKAVRAKTAMHRKGITLSEEMPTFSGDLAYRISHCFALKKFLAEKDRTKSEEKVLGSFTRSAHSPGASISTRRVSPELGERQARCSVLVEGVDEPLSLDDALAIATNWDALNERRVSLIEKKAAQKITEAETEELQHLQRLAWAKRQMVMPLPFKELAAIEEALRRMQLWQDE